LRTGYLKGNEFRIILADSQEDSEKVEHIKETILKLGLPNFYGPQRFGRDGANLTRGMNILKGGGDPSGGWLRKFFLSAVQSHLFNLWLVERMERGLFDRLIDGDIGQKTAGSKVFGVRDPSLENGRFLNGEIVYTGPIYGFQMRRPRGEEEKIENEILNREGLAMKHFRKNNLKGSRRAALIRLKEITVNKVEEGLEFRFVLPAGAYATIVMREFIKQV
jgi:tRNA pseudouridine13 synthase